MKVIILLIIVLILGIFSLAFPFDVWVNGVKMQGVKWIKIVTPDGHELIFTAPAPTPITSTTTPRARRWYGPAPRIEGQGLREVPVMPTK